MHHFLLHFPWNGIEWSWLERYIKTNTPDKFLLYFKVNLWQFSTKCWRTRGGNSKGKFRLRRSGTWYQNTAAISYPEAPLSSADLLHWVRVPSLQFHTSGLNIPRTFSLKSMEGCPRDYKIKRKRKDMKDESLDVFESFKLWLGSVKSIPLRKVLLYKILFVFWYSTSLNYSPKFLFTQIKYCFLVMLLNAGFAL